MHYMFSTDFSTNCAPYFIQNTDILIYTLGKTNAENKGLESYHNNVCIKFERTLIIN